MTGCAITSGLQTYDLPNEGVYQTDLGTQVNVIQLTQESLFAVQPAEINLRQDYAHLFNTSHKNYKLSSGDVLSIYLWAYPDITPPTTTISNEQSVQANGYQIDQNGYIQFPMIGRYKAAGKSLTQVNQELRSQLARYLKTPDVIARVLSYQGQRFSVQGNVTKGGQFALSDQPVSVYTALGMAGGVNSQQGDNASITLVRQGRTYKLNTIELEKAGLSLHNLLIQPNDTLYVNSRENQKIYVVRSQPNATHTEVYQMDLSSIADFGLANQFKMRSNDIVYVDASGLARWQRVINQVIPFSSIVNTANNLGN